MSQVVTVPYVVNSSKSPDNATMVSLMPGEVDAMEPLHATDVGDASADDFDTSTEATDT